MYRPSSVLFLAALALPVLGLPLDEANAGAHQLAERQFGGAGLAINCPHDRIVGERKGTSFHHWQVTDNIYCGQNSECSIARMDEHTFGIEINAGVNLGGPLGEFAIHA